MIVVDDVICDWDTKSHNNGKYTACPTYIYVSKIYLRLNTIFGVFKN